MFCLSRNNEYVVFPNSPTVTLFNNTLFSDKDYIITLKVEDTNSFQSSEHSIGIYAASGTLLKITIESRHDKNGYIDYTQPSLFLCNSFLNNSSISTANATYTWSITDSTGDLISVPSAIFSLNSLKLPSVTFKADESYKISVTVSYPPYSGTTSTIYSTFSSSKYSFEVQPSVGTALSTEFVMACITQSFSFPITEFAFGYIKSSKRYLLTRSSPVAIHNVILPQGEAGNSLTVYCEILTMQEKKYYIERKVTVNAKNITKADFIEIVEETVGDSITESVKLKLLYEEFKDQMSVEERLKALNLVLDGLQRDGLDLKGDQDEATRLTVAQVLKMVSGEFGDLRNSEIIDRTVQVFYQMTVNENLEVASGKVIEFDEQTVEDLFEYVDQAFSSISFADISIQNDLMEKLLKGLEYVIRGSSNNDAPSNLPVIRTGTSVTAMMTKINSKGFDSQVISTFDSPDGEEVKITVPKSAIFGNDYVQLVAIFTKELVYKVITVNSGSSIQTGMLRVVISDTDGVMDPSDTKVKSNKIDMQNLADPIQIKFPFSDKVGKSNTIACGFTKAANDVISSVGIETEIHSNY